MRLIYGDKLLETYKKWISQQTSLLCISILLQVDFTQHGMKIALSML